MINKSKLDSCVYLIYGEGNELLYVGISNNHITRIDKHILEKEWSEDIVKIEISEYINRNQAHIYEIYYISKFNPIHNKDFNIPTENFNLNLPDLKFVNYNHTDKETGILPTTLNNELINSLGNITCKVLLFFIANKDADGYVRYDGRYLGNDEMYKLLSISKKPFGKSLVELKNKNIIERIYKGRVCMTKILI